MVRRVCPYCSRPSRVNPDEQAAYEQEMREKRSEFITGQGCSYCANTGYLGRTGIFEFMVMSEPIRRLVLTGGSADEIRVQAQKEGTITLWHDGMVKVKTGLTTPYEIIRNAYSISTKEG